MSDEFLVHQAEVNLEGNLFEIHVYRRIDGRYFAKTRFGENDIIINDGLSLEEALTKHERVLPLAVTSRHLLHQVRGFAKSAD